VRSRTTSWRSRSWSGRGCCMGPGSPRSALRTALACAALSRRPSPLASCSRTTAAFDGALACSTDLAGSLDAAMLRRFELEVRSGSLRRSQAGCRASAEKGAALATAVL
jgi:hypothetical protein